MWQIIYISFSATIVFSAGIPEAEGATAAREVKTKDAEVQTLHKEVKTRDAAVQTLHAGETSFDLPREVYDIAGHRGSILIINIRKVRDAAERYGSEADVANLWNTFFSLAYYVQHADDQVNPLTRRGLLEKVRQFANDPLQEPGKATVVALMSHSDEAGDIITSDCGRVLLSEVKHELSASKFLKGKPKLLIVLSCQGGDRDIIRDICKSDPVMETECQGNQCWRWPRLLRRRPQPTPNTTPEPEFVLAPKKVDADFVMIKSSQQGGASYRHVYLGSWLVTILCSKVRKIHQIHQKLDVMTMLLHVSRDVNIMSDINMDEDKCITSSSLKKVFFLPYRLREYVWHDFRYVQHTI